MFPKGWRSMLSIGACALLVSACKEEKSVIFTVRVAILPDGSGYLRKEVRSWDKTRQDLTISQVVEGVAKELYVVRLDGFPEMKFRATLKGDTVLLHHTQTGLDTAVQVMAPGSFPVRFSQVSGGEWPTAGFLEDDPVFYSDGKLKAAAELMRER